MHAPTAKRTKAARTQRYLWTREAYEKLAETDIFAEGPRVELIDGEIIEMSPQRSLHVTAVDLVATALNETFGPGYFARSQGPISLGDRSMPEPDVAVIPGFIRDYRDAHPSGAELVVEVSDTTLRKDRGRKLNIYARFAIPEYWIVNLQDFCLEVFRDPSGETYGTKFTLYKGDRISPVARPEANIPVADLLP